MKSFTRTREAARRLQEAGKLPRLPANPPPSPLSPQQQAKGLTMQADPSSAKAQIVADEDMYNPSDDNPIQGTDRVFDHATNPARSTLDQDNPVGSRSGWMWQTVFDWITRKMQTPTPETGQYMHWQGVWRNQVYAIGSVVRDGLWTMVALTETAEKAAPELAGSASWLMPDVPAGTDTPVDTTLIQTGLRWSGGLESDAVLGLRYWPPQLTANIDHKIFVREDLGGGLYRYIVEQDVTPAAADAWQVIPIQGVVFDKDKTYEIILQVRNSTTFNAFNGTWTFSSGTANYLPLPGEMYYKTNENLLIVNNEDADGADRITALASVIAGTLVTFDNNSQMTVDALGASDATHHRFYGSFTGFPVPQSQNVIFSVPTTASTEYIWISDYWTGNTPADVVIQGMYSQDGDAFVYDTNGYGIDLYVDQVQFSDDWDVVALSDNLTP